MAYIKTNWVNGTTPVNADNMNKIENELAQLDGDITTLNGVVASKGGQLFRHAITLRGDDSGWDFKLVFVSARATAYPDVNTMATDYGVATIIPVFSDGGETATIKLIRIEPDVEPAIHLYDTTGDGEEINTIVTDIVKAL